MADGVDETSIAGTTVSAIAINVVHCESVSTSPSAGGGRGESRGAMRFNCAVVMVVRVVPVDIQNGCCYLGRSMELRLFNPLAKSH